jgi:hypothetical protein
MSKQKKRLCPNVPFIYQASIWDCASTTFLNVFRYFFTRIEMERDERIKAIKSIYQLSLDKPFWTSNDAFFQILHRLKRMRLGLEITELTITKNKSIEVCNSKLRECLQSREAVAYVDVVNGKYQHEILALGCSDDSVLCFDPALPSKADDYYKSLQSLEHKGIVSSLEPGKCDGPNLQIKINHLFSTEDKTYSLGSGDRYCLLFRNGEQ